MNDVFISYSRRDKVFVQKLYDCLTAANRTVWADWDSIPAASDWFAEIKQGIQETDSVVFVLSPEWIKSNECRKELNYAVEMGKRLFPILYIPVDPKDVPPELGKINWVYMRDTDDFDKAIQTLCSAMDTDLEWIKTHTRIQIRALEWEKKNRSASFALRGEDLTEGEKFIAGGANKNPVPTQLQSEYILASRKDATRRQRQTLVGVIAALVISIALGIVAFFQRQEAVKQKSEAIKQSQISLARQLAAQAQSVKLTGKLAGSEQVAALLDIQSLKIYSTGEAANFLIDSHFAHPIASVRHESDVLSVAFSPDGKYVASGSIDGTLSVWEAKTGRQIAHMIHNGGLLSVAFSPNGKYVISRDFLNAYIWEVATGNELSHIKQDTMYSVAFSLDDKNIVSSGCDKYDTTNSSCTKYSINIWEVATGKKLNSIAYDDQGDFSGLIAFSADGKHMVSAGIKYIHVWEIDSGREVARILHSIAGGVRSLAFSPGGEYVVSGGNDGTVRVWEIAASREAARMTMSLGDPVPSVAFSPDGKYVAAGSGEWSKSPLGSYNHTIRVWNAFTGVEVTRITQNSTVHAIAFSSDGNFIVSTECDKQDENLDCSQSSARVWEIRTDRERMSQEGDLRSAVFSPDGKYVASLSDVVQIWEPFTGKRIASFKHDAYTYSFAFSPDGKYIVTAGCDKYDANYNCIQDSARVWEFATGKEVRVFKHGEYLLSFTFSSDGRYIITVDCDKYDAANYNCTQGSARVWEFATGKEVSNMAYKGYVYFDAFSSDGKNIISNDDHTVVIWEMNTGKEISRISDKDNVILAISSDGKYVVSSRCDKLYGNDCIQGFTRIWKSETGEDIVSKTDSTDRATFSPDGRYIISDKCITRNPTFFYCTQSSLSEWKIATGEKIIQMTYEGNLLSVAFSPDGKHVVLNSNRVLETATGKEIAHTTYAVGVIYFAFSPDGNYVVSAFEDGSARVWELITGKEIAYTKHAGSVSAVAFSPDGKYVVSGGCIESNMVGCTKSSVRVWLWQPEDIIVNACAYLPRNLTRVEWAQFIGNAMSYQAVCENLPIEPEVTGNPTVTP